MLNIQSETNDAVPSNGMPAFLLAFDPDVDAHFCTAALETYAFARRESVVIDALSLIAAVEFADRSFARSSMGWARRIELSVPVYDPRRWQSPGVLARLHEALRFLSGDFWSIKFVKRQGNPLPKPQDTLPMPVNVKAVLAYSDGLDSRAVANLAAASGENVLKVRVGSKASAGSTFNGKPEAFTGIPYELRHTRPRLESSARSRGFKFAFIGGIAAYLVDTSTVLVPESGQGIFGPAMLPLAHAYADFRNHPVFLSRIENLLFELVGHKVQFEYPRIWRTKAETLSDYVESSSENKWADTRSCWQDSRWCSFEGKRRQCGICAACMLRRMSVKSAGLSESNDTYICEDLTASSIEQCVVPGFTHLGKSFREYAIAGVLQLDQFAELGRESSKGSIHRHSVLTSYPLKLSVGETEQNLTSLVQRHANEWSAFINDLGSQSFLRQWTGVYI